MTPSSSSGGEPSPARRTPAPVPPSPSPSSSFDYFDVRGKILRKKNVSADYAKLAVLGDGEERSVDVYVPRNDKHYNVSWTPLSGEDWNFLYVDAVVRVVGRANNAGGFRHATEVVLVRCAPNVRMIKELLGLLPTPDRDNDNDDNFFDSLAPTVDMEGGELRLLVETNKNKSKVAVRTIVERLTGVAAKAPPRYRPGRVRQSDMRVLEAKEAEGRVDVGGANNASWELCRPCRSPSDESSATMTSDAAAAARRGSSEESAAAAEKNLPDGADDAMSAHGKLTRTEYLETKKNRQASWFVGRIRRMLLSSSRGNRVREEGEEEERRRRRRPDDDVGDDDADDVVFLDVGGGRGDLAVRIAIEFPRARVVVVDRNEKSIDAGREYAARRGVGDRIDFRCVDFSEYVENYGRAEGEDEVAVAVDFVVALHACGDLSDMALDFARLNRCDFVVCPCCYPKRYLAPKFVPHWHGLCTKVEVDSLSRLAELDDHREVSRRAMAVVNSMRRSAFHMDGDDDCARLEEFDDRLSKRNLALVGVAGGP